MCILYLKVNTFPIAFGRLVPVGEKKYELSGIYVKETLRRQGHGRKLIQFILENTDEDDIIYCVPFKHLVPYYMSFGWRGNLTDEEKCRVPQQVKEKLEWCDTKFTANCTLLILYNTHKKKQTVI
jgi:GNAT superfamily N-acetyltransferase